MERILPFERANTAFCEAKLMLTSICKQNEELIGANTAK